MITTNPFFILSETVPAIATQSFVIVMAFLVTIGTLVDIIHKKNVKYFFENAKKAKQSAKKTLTTGEKTSVIIKTVSSDILTTSELGAGKRRAAHLLGMYGTILFWLASVIMIFCYSEIDSIRLSHTAHSRIGFAKGAILAAEFIKDKKGVFSMEDVINSL